VAPQNSGPALLRAHRIHRVLSSGSCKGQLVTRFQAVRRREGLRFLALGRTNCSGEWKSRKLHPVRLAYQPPANSTFLSEQTSHQQPVSSTFLSEQTSTSHQPPAKRTGCRCGSCFQRAFGRARQKRLAEPQENPCQTNLVSAADLVPMRASICTLI
jgi:hypothetical protein